MALWCSRLARQPVTLEVDGSSPFGVAKKSTVLPPGSTVLFFSLGGTDSKGGSWKQSGGLLQPPWLFRRKASPFGVAKKRTTLPLGGVVFCRGHSRMTRGRPQGLPLRQHRRLYVGADAHIRPLFNVVWVDVGIDPYKHAFRFSNLGKKSRICVLQMRLKL